MARLSGGWRISLRQVREVAPSGGIDAENQRAARGDEPRNKREHFP